MVTRLRDEVGLDHSAAHDSRGLRAPTRWQRGVAIALCCALVQVQWAGLLRGEGLVQGAYAQSMANSMTVIVVPQNPKEAELAVSLERLLSQATGRLEMVRAFSLSPLPGEADEEAAERLVEDALRALLLRTPKRATERVAAARALLDKATSAGDARLYARLFKAEALIAMSRNDLIPARDALTRSLVLFGKQTEEEFVAYGSQAVDLLKSCQATVSAAPTGDIEVGRKANDAEVYVDGVYRGRAPTKVEDLIAGDHRVTLRLSGSVAKRAFVRVEAGKTASYDAELDPASFREDLASGRQIVAANFGQPSVIEDRIRELRNQIGVDQILVVRAAFTKKSTVLTGYFLGSDGVFKKAGGELEKNEDYFEAVARFVADGAGAKLEPDPAGAPLDQRKSVVVASQTQTTEAARKYIDPNEQMFADKKDGEEPITSKWWFWAAIGGGVALIGTLGAILASDTAQGPEGATGTVRIKLHKASGN